MFSKAEKMHREKAPLTRELQVGLIALSLTALNSCLQEITVIICVSFTRRVN